jgi:radical SAM superfamily enzyme YgiQ (UPF0313 family)
MRVLFAYLPVIDKKGYFCVSQQRFSKIRGDKELIYPLIVASGCTLLKRAGFEIKYLDSICLGLSKEEFIRELTRFSPQLLIFEAKTPVIKSCWKIVNTIKEKLSDLIIAAVGDHVSVLPEETLENSYVDYVIVGGDYDLSILELAKYLRDGGNLPKGLFYREGNKIVNSGPGPLIENLDEIPFIDRELVPWKDYHEGWRLFDRFMYMMGSRGCAYRCTFCAWPWMLHKGKVRFRSVPNVIEEIEILKKNYSVEEIFFDDDTFTWNKDWVLSLCEELIRKGININWSCNGRVDNVDNEMLTLMRRSGCRMIKFGVESASQYTLDKINKGYTIEDIKRAFSLTNKKGILTHGTFMFGFPWETPEDMVNTIKFAKELNCGEVQFSLVIPYPGTMLYKEAEEKGWLEFAQGEWEKFDMSTPVLKTPLKAEEILKLYRKAWREFYFRPSYILSKLLKIRSIRELKWLTRGFFSIIRGHL